MTLTEFLLARFAEDEAAALEPWLPLLQDVDAWWSERDSDQLAALDEQGDDVKGLAKTIMQIEQARGTYARVLAECEAKRRIVEEHDGSRETGCTVCYVTGVAGMGPMAWPCRTLRMLALPYADHPDYDPKWAV